MPLDDVRVALRDPDGEALHTRGNGGERAGGHCVEATVVLRHRPSGNNIDLYQA